MGNSRSLGALGKRNKPRPQLTFDWFGQEIRVNPGAGELELADFLERAENINLDALEDNGGASLGQSLEAFHAVRDFLQCQIHPDDWAQFWDLAKVHQQGIEDLMETAMTIVEAVSDFPTTPPSASSAGPAPTPPSSGDVLSSRALSLLSGRPDLQAAIMRAREGAGAG